jgi:hypothetical protein
MNVSLGLDVSWGKVARALETPAYIAVGFGVLGFQRAQVRRRELERHVAGATSTVNQKLGEVSGDVVERLPREARDLLTAAGDLVQDLPREAGDAAKELVALSRLVLGAARGSGRPRPDR